MTVSEMLTLQKPRKRNRKIAFAVERWMQCLLLQLKSQSKLNYLTIQLVWASAQLLVTYVSLIYQVHEFFIWFLVYLNETRKLG